MGKEKAGFGSISICGPVLGTVDTMAAKFSDIVRATATSVISTSLFTSKCKLRWLVGYARESPSKLAKRCIEQRSNTTCEGP